MKVAILAGGMGTRLSEMTDRVLRATIAWYRRALAT